MKMQKDVDVIVVGGGPVGLMLACELKLGGVNVTLLERRAVRVTQSRALSMHGRTLEILHLRGMAPRFISRGLPLSTGHFAVLDTRLDFSVCDSTTAFSLFIPQSLTEQLLEEWAGELGVDIQRRATVASVRQDNLGVSVQGTQDGQPFTLTGQYLVGADGARSRVRHDAGIAFTGHGASMTMMQGDVSLDRPPESGFATIYNQAGCVMLVAQGSGCYRVVLIDFRNLYRPQHQPASFDELKEAVCYITGQNFGMHSPVWLSRFDDETALAECYHRGRIFLAGDAAHIHFPAGGQGMNVGMQDAMNLGWKLAGVINGYTSPTLLDSYHAERYPIGYALNQNTEAQKALIIARDTATLALRALMNEWLRIPEFNKKLAGAVAAFDVRYPVMLTVPPSGWAILPDWTGRRVPDWPLRSLKGAETSLYHHLHQGNWLLLRLTDTAASLSGNNDERWCNTLDARVNLALLPALTGVSALLIRPDGHADYAVGHPLAGMQVIE